MKSDSYKKRLVRQAVPEDRIQLEDLWIRCFGDTEAFTKYYFDWYFPQNRVWVCEEEGRILGQLHENPYDLSVFGEKARLPYIVGVSTEEHFRHQGIMRSMLMQSLKEAAANELPFVYLMPADEAIYLPFGFAYIYAQDVQKLAAVRPDSTDAVRLRSGELSYAGITAKRPSSYTAFAAAAAIGNSILEQHCDVYTQRDVWYMKRLAAENQAEGGDFLLLYADDGPAGYLSFGMEEKTEILEFAVLEPYKEAASAWLREAFSDTDTVLLSMPGAFVFPETEKKPVIMGRITNLSSYLSMLKPQSDFSVVIETTDKQLPENAGIWLWECNEGKTSVCRAPERSPKLHVEIGELMQWTMGYKDAPSGFPSLKNCRLFINEIV